MAQYTVLGREEIGKLLEEYGIVDIKGFKHLKGGSENTNYLIRASEEKYVLSICEQKSKKEAEELALLLEHLAKHDFSTSLLIRTTQDKVISYWKGKPVMLKVFLEGEIMQDLPLPLLDLIGKKLGKLHQIKAPNYLPQQINYGIERFREVEFYDLHSSFDNWLKNTAEYVSEFISDDLPKALIHSDLFFSNVIVSKDARDATIMDFEEATYYFRVFDLGMTIVGLCVIDQKIDLAKVKHLLQGYETETKLTHVERMSLKAFTVYAAAAMAFWRHKNFNYTKPDEAMKDHYLELKWIVDDVKALPNDYFLRFL